MGGVFSYQMYADLKKRVNDIAAYSAPSTNPIIAPERTFMGIGIHTSGAFPIENTCRWCDGTGEGRSSTYCEKCSGAGRNRFDGMMRNGSQTILIETPLPKAFQPSFPRGIVAAPPLSKGLA